MWDESISSCRKREFKLPGGQVVTYIFCMLFYIPSPILTPNKVVLSKPICLMLVSREAEITVDSSSCLGGGLNWFCLFVFPRTNTEMNLTLAAASLP